MIHHVNIFPDKQCDSLLDPVHGEVHQTGRYLGDRAIYTCIPGEATFRDLGIQ
jgi:hypothetical protein